MKYFLFGVLLAAFGGFGYWAVTYSGWFSSTDVPYNPPTQEELQRIKAVEESSMRPNPDAKPGAGVRPVGSLPKNTEPVLDASTTETTPKSNDSESTEITPQE